LRSKQFAQQTFGGPHNTALAPTGRTLKLRGVPLVRPAYQKANAGTLLWRHFTLFLKLNIFNHYDISH
jgi:hypothetical protein